MKIGASFWCALFCFVMLVSVSCAEVYINEELPEDWKERNILRLTQYKLDANDGMLLEVGGQTMLIDGGVQKYNIPLLEEFQERNLLKMDYIFNTHPHDDHIDAQFRLVRRGLKADVFISAFPETYGLDEQRRMVKQLRESAIPYQQIEHGYTMSMGDAKLVFIQSPEGDTNGRSCMTHITFGESTVLLTADTSGRVHRYFQEALPPEWLKAQILKFPHHGLTQMVPEFLTLIDPSFVFVTNTYDGGANAKLQLTARQIPYFFSSYGTVIMETDGHDWYITQKKGF